MLTALLIAQTLYKWIGSCQTCAQLVICEQALETLLLQPFQHLPVIAVYKQHLQQEIRSKRTELQINADVFPNASLRIGFMRAAL